VDELGARAFLKNCNWWDYQIIRDRCWHWKWFRKVKEMFRPEFTYNWTWRLTDGGIILFKVNIFLANG